MYRRRKYHFLCNKKGGNLGRDGSQFVDMAVVI